jgi:hypothetical protein
LLRFGNRMAYVRSQDRLLTLLIDLDLLQLAILHAEYREVVVQLTQVIEGTRFGQCGHDQ